MNLKKKYKKIQFKEDNHLLNSNKKPINKKPEPSANVKLLYDKIKKKTQSNSHCKRKNESFSKREKTYKPGDSFQKRESLPIHKTNSKKFSNKSNKNPKKKKINIKSNNGINYKFTEQNLEKERRHSLNNIKGPLLSLDNISASYNQMKEKRNKIINKFKKNNISSKEQAFYILSTSPVLRLCEQLIFSKSSKNIKNVISIKTILTNHNIFLNSKVNELQNEISLCDKRINSSFIASKIADITLNFITSSDEQEFQNFDILEINKDSINSYYNYIKLLYLLLNDKYEDKLNGKNLKIKLYEIIKQKGFNYIRDYLYHIYIAKKEKNNIVSKIDIINNDILKNEPNLLKIEETLKMCRFVAFSNYLIKEIIDYSNNINDMVELKYRAQNLLDIVYDKINKIQNKNRKSAKSNK